MRSDTSPLSNIGSINVQFDANHVNIGPAPDLILVHFRAIGAQTAGPFLRTAVFTEGYEDAEFRADGIVTYRAHYLLALDGSDPLLLTASGMADVGEEAYEHMLDDRLPEAARIDASARFVTSSLKYRWLGKLQCSARGDRDFRGAAGFFELFARFDPSEHV